MSAAEHAPFVIPQAGGGFTPSCTCGWKRSGWWTSRDTAFWIAKRHADLANERAS